MHLHLTVVQKTRFGSEFTMPSEANLSIGCSSNQDCNRSTLVPLYDRLHLFGLNRSQAILGIYFVREQQLVIDLDHVFFKNLPKNEQAMCATLRAPRDFGISPRTVLRTELSVHAARGETLIPELFGIASSAIDEVRVWDTFNKVAGKGCICTVVTNMSDEEIILRRGAVVGFFTPLSASQMKKGLQKKQFMQFSLISLESLLSLIVDSFL